MNPNQFVSVWLPRIAGVIAGYFVGEAAKHGLTLDQEQVTALMITVYFAVHRLISRKTNPGDATKTAVVEFQKGLVQRKAASAPADIPRWSDGSDEGKL